MLCWPQIDRGQAMIRIQHSKIAAVLAGLCAGATALTPTAMAASYFTVSSSSIKDGARIPVRFGADDPKRACSPKVTTICPCPGKNVSPQLAWHNAPAGTKSFAILMYDVDGQYGAGVSHWVAYNIAPTTMELKEGDGAKGVGFTGGSGTRANANYLGPCPPQGDGPHHYLITVMALDLEPGLAAGMTREQFQAAAKGHQLASASIGGLFAREY
jgi:Raf kinase inhibitor-like YbhB/YbcL family protein